MENRPELDWIDRATLTEDPTPERFSDMLGELDYEIEGGTLEEPLWAWMKHPWYAVVGMTEDECIAILQRPEPA